MKTRRLPSFEAVLCLEGGTQTRTKSQAPRHAAFFLLGRSHRLIAELKPERFGLDQELRRVEVVTDEQRFQFR